MTIQRMIELLEIEHECMLRGAHDDCDRNCADCELVQDDGDLHEMYTDVIALLKEKEAIVKQWTKEIADIQLTNDPNDYHGFMSLDEYLENKYKKGIWDGLQIALNIISEGR